MTKTKKTPRGRSSPTQSSMTGSLAVRARKRLQKPRTKKVSWRDEQVEGMGVSDQPSEEFTDPAILVIRETRKICYSKDALLKLREHPLSKKKPDFVDPSEVSPSIWDPERWGFERKKSDTPIENGPRSGGDGPSEHRRRPGDPRERIRKENDGIVLSPQRRSFNSGCFVPVRVDATRSNRSHSPLGPKTEGSHMGIREIQSNTRRIGSGRILRDSWDFNDKLDAGDNEYSYRGQQRNNNDRDDKYERRSFGRDFDMTRDRENNNKDSRRMSKGYERRRISENREQEEPEWFSGGPLSQNDTIELRGFDDEKPSRKKLSPSNMKRTKDVKKKSEPIPAQNNSEEKKIEENVALPEPTAAPSSQVGDQNENNEKTENVRKEEEKDNKVDNIEKTDEESRVSALVNDHSFNFEDILKCDSIPGLLTNGVGGDGDNTKSRFSQWFRKESPEKQESRRSSLHEDHIIKHLLKDIGETSVTIPGDSEAYFAPISPAANTGVTMGGKREFQQQSQPINIMDILQRGKQQPDPMKQSVPGKILSLDELEAKIRQNVEASTGISTKHQQQKPDEDMTAAFKKLLEQAQTGGHPAAMNPSLNKTQPMSLLEMLNHSQQQDEAARLSGANPHLLGPTNSNMAGMQHHQHVPNDLTMKLQQAQLQQQKQQMDMLNKLINATTSVHPQQLRASPLQDLVMQQSRDLLNRPEAQAILQAMHQRIPSPRELQVHTQNILQRALIKKKLEEQQENYRKKQELQRGQSPNNSANQAPTKNVTSPTPLAFTPTSVLRKMTADKDEGKENKVNIEGKVPQGRALTGMRAPQTQGQWNPNVQYMSTKHPGRPIVKANNNFQVSMTDQFFGQQAPQPQQQQQQQVMQQQRAQQQQLAYQQQQQQQQQQRKVLTPQVMGPQFTSNQGVPQSQYNPQQYSTNQQFTQQQLRAQHQHRPANQQQSAQQHQQMAYQQQQSNQQNMGGGSWQPFFSNSHPANRNTKTGLESDGGRLTSNATSSTTTVNDLARWFPPELLERARGGELPSTAGLSQHVLSLEDIERQTAPPVHN